MRTSNRVAYLHSALLAAGLLAWAAASPAKAGDGDRFVGSAQPYAGKDCSPAADVTIMIDGRQLTFVATPGPMFRGDIRQDGSFRLLPMPQSIVYKRMLAPPVLEGSVNGDRIVGEVTSRWCTYRFAARRV